MGWSCAVRASWVTERWEAACYAQSNSQNVFEANGEKYFWEISRTEHHDGAITGSIWKFLPNDKCRKVGTFRVEGNGVVTRAPKFLKDASPTAKQLQDKHVETFGRLPAGQNLDSGTRGQHEHEGIKSTAHLWV